MVKRVEALKSGKPFEMEKEGAQGWMGRLQDAPLLLQLALVFLGGLLLNLTPCVYPMIPITVGYFGAQSESRIGKTFSLALVYVLGLALVYSVLGVSAALTGRLFGSVLQSPLATGFVALVLFLLALSMFGLFTIQPPQFLMARSGAKKGIGGALAMGALLGVVAAPCVGPVVAALLTYVGAKGDPALGFALFFTLSLGLGLPYLVLGTFSGAIKALPKSGLWLERFKKVFAVPLLVASLYYGYLAVSPLLASTGATATADAAVSSQQKHWSHATEQTLAAARKAGRPVVLDFRANWCLPCLKLEREVFSRPEVHRAAESVELLQVDLTSAGS
jgi:thiol:disulfide interchange protein DsbD